MSFTTSPRSLWKSFAPLLVALLPAAFGFGHSLLGPQLSHAEPAPTRAPLAFHQYQVNLGRVEPKRDHYARFTFTNHGNKPIELRKLETSCGCLTQHQSKKIVDAGEQGEFFLRIQSANQEPGAKQYTCKAIYGPVDEPAVSYETDLRFLITLPELTVVVRPRVLVFHQPNGNLTTHAVTITDLREKPLRILKASCDEKFVSVRIDPESPLHEADREAGVVGRIEVSVGEVPKGRHECEVRVITSDPEFNLLRIPVRVHGAADKATRTRPDFEPSEPSDASDDDARS